MCLMCMYYLDSCDKPECFQKYKDANDHDHYFNGKSFELFLWTGATEPCEHIKASHDSNCSIFDPEDRVCDCSG